MIFSKKKKPVRAYTVEVCSGCGMSRKRGFGDGDVLFSESSQCPSCKGMMAVQKIFGQPDES